MTTLFGLDIANIVNDAIVEAGNIRTGVLKRTRNSYVADERDSVLDPSDKDFNLTGSTHAQLQQESQETMDEYSFNGYVERKSAYKRGTAVVEGGEFLSILGASVKARNDVPADRLNPEPAIGDVAELDGEAWKITAIDEVDPAKALYKCRVEKCGS